MRLGLRRHQPVAAAPLVEYDYARAGNTPSDHGWPGQGVPESFLPGTPETRPLTAGETLAGRRERLLGKAYRLFYDYPVHIIKGEGVWLTDADGRHYLDVYNNVPHVGHCHPHVVEAVCKQTATLNTHTRYLHENVLDYADMLTGRLPPGLDIAMFACSGTEANELALRLARAATGGRGVIVTEHAYHGNSQALAQISTDTALVEPRPDHVVTVPAPDTYHGPYRGEDAAERYAGHVEEAIGVLRQRGHRPTALIVDTVFSSDGLPRTPGGYLAKAAQIVRHAGGLFVADEVQAGFGRTGTAFWGFENHGARPDIVTMGKPMGNGYPISALVTRPDVIDNFQKKTHYFNTFGGNPVACAAARAVLEVLDAEQLQARALAVGQYLLEGLQKLAGRHELIGDIRGSGLFIGVELVRNRVTREPATEAATRVVNGLRERGVLAGATGPAANVLKIRPPMVFVNEHADILLERLDATLTEIARDD